MHSVTRTVFGGLAVAATLAAGTACGGGPEPALGGTAAARPPAATTAAAPAGAGAPSIAPAPARPAPATPPPAEVALIDRVDRGTVSWTDGTLVISKLGDQVSEALPGAEHKHTAALAADAVFFAPSNCGANQGEVHLDSHGLGTVACTKEEFVGLVNGTSWDAKIFFNASGEASKIAGRYHP